MWLFTYNHTCFGYIQITTLNNKNTFGAPYICTFSKFFGCHVTVLTYVCTFCDHFLTADKTRYLFTSIV